MFDQLFEVVPHGLELLWELFVAMVFALLAAVFLERMKRARRVPRLALPRIALDLTKPAVVFVLQVVAVLAALSIFHLMGKL
ncbi:hypothetical protein [Streptomyces sp. NBC_01334]|uniref:hypothetical protein n=1 Tax=Streptomyces sp. NBC_01334 TaxID=2903827 RepID=UPI002E15A1A8|nr:hypothetical protein OG736_23890 [Streptomyces sp. NBC_01334]